MVTINSKDYIVYANVVEADTYLAADITRGIAWAALSTEDKNIRLVGATRRLNLLDYSGEKTGGVTQENEWPRTGASCNGQPITTTTDVPIEMTNATALLAGSINLTPGQSNAGTSGSNIERVRAGSAEVQFFSPQTGTALQDETAFRLVQCLLAGAAAGASTFGSAFGSTGANSESAFTDRDAPDLTEGYP